MSDIIETFPLDPNGVLASNKVVGEQHTITQSQDKKYGVIIPKHAPFYNDGLRIRFRSLDGQFKDLVYGQDYYLGNQFLSASKSTAKPIYGSIYILDVTLTGLIILDSYQALGGSWSISSDRVAEILADKLHNPLITSWEQIADLPDYFPVTNHNWNIYDMVGVSDINASLGNIEEALRTTSDTNINDHLNDFDNPHQVTKAQVGLGSVQNYSIASQAEARTGTATNRYMTPLRVKDAITFQAVTPLNNHIADLNNPHQTTAAQVGAPTIAVFNAGMASKLGKNEASVDTLKFNNKTLAEITAEILSGTAYNSIRFHGMTYEDFKTDIIEIVNNDPTVGEGSIALINEHKDDFSNPHRVTSVQVGLGNVENYGIATTTQAQAGTSNAVYMTPLRVKEAIDTQIGNKVDTHIGDLNNPHRVTKNQIGLGSVENYGIANSAQAQAGTNNTTYMTPLRVKEAFTQQSIPFTNHLTDYNNPHRVTAAQVGAPTLVELADGLATKLGKDETAVNSLKFTGLDFNEVKTNVLTGTANNSNNFDGMNSNDYRDYIIDYIKNDGSITISNANTLNGFTLEQIRNDILNSTIVNSDALNEMNVDQLKAWILEDIETGGLILDEGTVNSIYNAIVNKFNISEEPVNLNVEAADSGRLDGKSYLEIFNLISEEVKNNIIIDRVPNADNADRLDGKTYEDIMFDVSNTTSNNSLALDGKSLQDLTNDFNTMLSEGTSGNAIRFNGLSYSEFMESVKGEGDFFTYSSLIDVPAYDHSSDGLDVIYFPLFYTYDNLSDEDTDLDLNDSGQFLDSFEITMVNEIGYNIKRLRIRQIGNKFEGIEEYSEDLNHEFLGFKAVKTDEEITFGNETLFKTVNYAAIRVKNNQRAVFSFWVHKITGSKVTDGLIEIIDPFVFKINSGIFNSVNANENLYEIKTLTSTLDITDIFGNKLG